jgi:hypothetical protein
MSFGVDTLGGLIEKMKTLVNDTQNNYETFFDSTQLFKQGKMDSNEYFSKMGEFLVSSTALNFLSCRVILELKSAMDKNSAGKGKGGSTSPTSATMPSAPGVNMGSTGSSSGGGGFGVEGFISTGGNLGPSSNSSTTYHSPSSNDGYDLPMPQEAPSFRPVDIVINKQDSSSSKPPSFNSSSSLKKNCIVCGALIPKQAKFCNKCGNSQ